MALRALLRGRQGRGPRAEEEREYRRPRGGRACPHVLLRKDDQVEPRGPGGRRNEANASAKVGGLTDFVF